MPYADPEERREYRRAWYALHKESEKNHVKRRKLEIKRWIRNYKNNLKCSRCSENHPATIDFHHVNKGTKDSEIAHFVAEGYSINRIREELDKCEVLCANCHRKVHYQNNKL